MLKKLMILSGVSLFIVFFVVYSGKGMGSQRFTFTAQDMETMNREIEGTSKIRNISETVEGDVLCLGQLKTLFGEPLYMTKNLEEQYTYCIMAVDGEGKEIYLTAYSGPSGPAIGGIN